MTDNVADGWRRMRFKKNKVWMEVDDQGRPLIENKRVRIKYQLDQPHEYRVYPHHVTELTDAEPETRPGKAGPQKADPRKTVSDKRPRASDAGENGRDKAVSDAADDPGAVVIYTDGAASGNPGPAGIGAVLRYKGEKKEISEDIGHATNNIAELEAVRVALSALKRRDLPVRVHTDSSYVHGLLVHNWKAKKNPELVQSLRDLAKQFSDIRIIKVQGHKGVADNELADRLATSAIERHGRNN
jgi:ribonuclease HI